MRKPFSPLVKLILDLGPLAVFFIVYRLKGGGGSDVTPEADAQALIPATAALMVGTLISLTLHYWRERKLALMPLVTGVAVGVFGTLTIVLNDELFIKMKPTFVNLIFAAILLGGVAMKRPSLKYVLESAMKLTEEGWKKLSFRWGLFFVFLAVVNEVVWRNSSTAFWVDFKVFGMMTMTMLFTFAQIPLIQKHLIDEPEPSKAPGE